MEIQSAYEVEYAIEGYVIQLTGVAGLDVHNPRASKSNNETLAR
jgi:hypothetical protein